MSVHSGHSTSSAHKARFSSVRAACNQIHMCWWCLCYRVFSFHFYFVRSFSSGHVEIITSFPEDVQIAMVASSGDIVHKTVMMAFSKFFVEVRTRISYIFFLCLGSGYKYTSWLLYLGFQYINTTSTRCRVSCVHSSA